MADSITGGIDSDATLSQTTKDILNSVIAGITGTGTVPSVVTVDGTSVVSGVDANNNYQGVIVQSDAPVTGTVIIGTSNNDVILPANVGLTSQGLATPVTADVANTYLLGLINTALPEASTNPDVIEQRQSLTTAVNQILNKNPSTTTSAVNVINVIDSTEVGSGPQNIVINSNNASDILAINMSAIRDGNTLVLGNVSSAVIVGSGTVQVGSGTMSAIVIGDSADQLIIGGTGSDTLVGGGGSDTLVGGTGANTFGFNTAGEYTVRNLGAGDSFQFNIPGVDNFAQLVGLVTGATTVNGNTTYTFIGGSTITLVGITPDQVTANLIHFG
jgi:Ca2+-binding RTX toxin-like protein